MKRHFGITRNAFYVLLIGIVLTALAFSGNQELWRIYFAGVTIGAGLMMVAVDYSERHDA